MKLQLLVLMFALSFSISSQNTTAVAVVLTDSYGYGSGFSMSLNLENNGTVIKGNRFLLETFDTPGSIITNDNNKFILSNLNINLANRTFFTKLDNDSIYVYNKIDKVIIKEIEYEIIKDKVMKRIFVEENFTFLCDISKAKKEIVDFNTKFSGKKYKWAGDNEYYYTKGNNLRLHKLRLNKKSILSLFKNNREIITYVKKNKLSYKKEIDVAKIFQEFM